MSWKDTLLPASFRGVEFQVINTDDDIEHAVVINEMPYTDGATTEDMGRSGRPISLTAVFYGDDYENELKTFLDAIDKRGTAELIHPVFGSIQAQFQRAHIPHDAQRPDYTRVPLDFIQSDLDTPLFNRSLPSRPVEVVNEAADNALNAGSDQFLIDFTKLKTLPALIKDNLSSDMLNVMDNMKAYADQILAAQAWVSSTLYYLNNPSAFIDDLTGGLLSRINGIFSPMDLRLAYFGSDDDNNARGSISGVWKQPLTHLQQPLITSTNTQIQPALVAHVSVQQTIAIASAASQVFSMALSDPVMTPADIESIATDVRNIVNSTLDLVRATYPDIVQARPITEPLKAVALAVSDAATALIRMKPPLLNRVVEMPGNLQLIAHFWYGDFQRGDELLRLNPSIANPNFIAVGSVLRAYGA